MDSGTSCLCDSTDPTDPTEYLESLKKKYLERTNKLHAQQMELEKKIIKMEELLGNSKSPQIQSMPSTCSCDVQAIPRVFPDTPVRDLTPIPTGMTDVIKPQKPVTQQCSFFQKMVENAKSILSITCQCPSANTNGPDTSTATDSSSSETPTRENEPSTQQNVVDYDNTLTDKSSSKVSMCSCDDSDPNSLQEASCSCNLLKPNKAVDAKGQQVSIDPSSSTPPDSKAPTNTGKSTAEEPSTSLGKNCPFKESTASTLTSRCSCEVCKCDSSIADDNLLSLDNVSPNDGSAPPKVQLFADQFDSTTHAEVQATTPTESRGINIQETKITSTVAVTCCSIKSCPNNRYKDTTDKAPKILNTGIQAATITQSKGVNFQVPTKTSSISAPCCKVKSCPSNQPTNICRASCSVSKQDIQNVCRANSSGRQDGQNQCAFVGSPLLRAADFEITGAPVSNNSTDTEIKQTNVTTITEKVPCDCNTAEGPKKICQTSVFSLTSNDILEMQNVADLAKKEKEMKAHIQELQRREQAYQDMTKNVQNLVNLPPTTANQCCYCPKQTGPKDMEGEIKRISQELKLENQMLKSEMMDLKMQLKHCLEKVEGPMKQKLETEKKKCEHLQSQLQSASKNMLMNQDAYTHEMNQLKLQLCCACTNITELNQMNMRLKEEMAELDCMCAKLEDDLVKQKLNEAETIKRLTTRKFSGDGPSMNKPDEFRCDSSLDVIARKLSKTLKELAPCDECSQLPPELAGAARCIKDLTDMVRKRNTRTPSTQRCNCQSKPPTQPPSTIFNEDEEECCTCCCAPRDGGGEAARSVRVPKDEKTVKTLLAVPKSFVQKDTSSRFEVRAGQSSYYSAKDEPLRPDSAPCDKVGRPCFESKGIETKPEFIEEATREEEPSSDVGQPHHTEIVPTKEKAIEAREKVHKACKAPCSGMIEPVKDVKAEKLLTAEPEKGDVTEPEKGDVTEPEKGEAAPTEKQPDEQELTTEEIPEVITQSDATGVESGPLTSGLETEASLPVEKEGPQGDGSREEVQVQQVEPIADHIDDSEISVPTESKEQEEDESKTHDLPSDQDETPSKQFDLPDSESYAAVHAKPVEHEENQPEVVYGEPIELGAPASFRNAAPDGESRELPFEEERIGHFPVDIENKAYVIDEPPDGLHVTTTITGSGTLEIITEGPEMNIGTTLTYTPSGNIEVVTELMDYGSDKDQVGAAMDAAMEKYATEPSSKVPVVPEDSYITTKPSAVTYDSVLDHDIRDKPQIKAMPVASSMISGPSGPEADTSVSPSSVDGDLTSKLSTLSSGVKGDADLTSAAVTQPYTTITEGVVAAKSSEPTSSAEYAAAQHVAFRSQERDTIEPHDVKEHESAIERPSGHGEPAIASDQLESEATGGDLPSGEVFTPDQMVSDEEPQFTETKPGEKVSAQKVYSPDQMVSDEEHQPTTETKPGEKESLQMEVVMTPSQLPSSTPSHIESEGQPVESVTEKASEISAEKVGSEEPLEAVKADDKPVEAEDFVDTAEELPPEEGAGEIIAVQEETKPEEEEGALVSAEDVSKVEGDTLEDTTLPETVETIKTRDCGCQSVAQTDQSCQCCECKTIGVTTSGDKETITPQEDEMGKAPSETLEGPKEETDSEFVTISETTDAMADASEEPQPGDTLEEQSSIPTTKRDWSNIIDDDMLRKHPELVGKTSEEQQRILKELGYLGSRRVIDRNLFDQYPELASMSSEEQIKLLNELGITDYLVDETVVDVGDKGSEVLQKQLSDLKRASEEKQGMEIDVDEDMLSKHPELVGKTKEEQQEMLRSLGYKPSVHKEEELDIIVDEDMLSKHPELVGKSKEEQQAMLKSLGYKARTREEEEHDIEVDEDMLSKHPELVGKTKEEQQAMLRSLGYKARTREEEEHDIEVDEDMLSKHPELVGKTKEEQQALLRSLGYKPRIQEEEEEFVDIEDSAEQREEAGDFLQLSGKPSEQQLPSKEKSSKASVTISKELLAKHPELAGKSPEEQLKYLQEMGYPLSDVIDKLPSREEVKKTVVPEISKEVLKEHPELAGMTPEEQMDMLREMGYLIDEVITGLPSDELIKPEPSSKEVSVTCKAPCRSAATIHDDSKKTSQKDTAIGDASDVSVTKGRDISLQQRPSSRDDSASCKASCRTISVQSSKGGLYRKEIKELVAARKASTTSSSSDAREKEKQKKKHRPGEVPSIVSELSDKERPLVETSKKSRSTRKKRSTSARMMDCLKCHCADPCTCEVCSPEVIERRQRALNQPVRSCDCAPQTRMPQMPMTYSMPPQRHPPGCSCNNCLCNPCTPCPPRFSGHPEVAGGESATSDEDKRKLRKHPSNCECVDCLCLPKIKKLAQTKEYPVVYDKKQVYQVKVKCDTCTNAKNARRYLEQQRSRIPISTSSANPPRVRSDARPANEEAPPVSESPAEEAKEEEIKDVKPEAQQDEKKAPVSAKLSKSDSIYNSIACDCTECTCIECPDKGKGGKSCCCAGPCSCEPCKVDDLTRKLREMEAKLAAAQAAAKPPTEAAVPRSGPHDEECTCPECVCPGAEGMPSPASKVPSAIPPSSATAPKQSEEECTCPECICPGAEGMPTAKKAASQVLPTEGPPAGDHPEDCDCPECVCPGKDGISAKPSAAAVPSAKPSALAPPSAKPSTLAPTAGGGDEECNCTICECPGSTSLPPTGEIGVGPIIAECDCQDCKCSPCADPKKAPPPPPPADAQVIEDEFAGLADCDCQDCKCSPCVDPKRGKGPKSQVKVTAKPSEKAMEGPQSDECDCAVCECLGEGDIPGKESKGTMPEKVEHPEDCDCDECLCLEEIIQSQTGVAEKGVQPPVEKEVHALNCTCPECLCAPCTAVRETHAPGCNCDVCICESCDDETKAKPPTEEAPPGDLIKTADVELHPGECSCIKCMCDACSDPTKEKAEKPPPQEHGEGCKCIDCLCKECLMRLEPLKHEEGCQCAQCVCVECLKKMQQGDQPSEAAIPGEGKEQTQRGPNCVCETCICIDCVGQNADAAAAAAQPPEVGGMGDKETHSPVCDCPECKCPETDEKEEIREKRELKDVSQKVSEAICDCPVCQCPEDPNQELGHTEAKVGDGPVVLDPPMFEVPQRIDCDCKQCDCIICENKKAAAVAGGPVERAGTMAAKESGFGLNTAEAPPFEVPIRVDCMCAVCECITCNKKAPEVRGIATQPSQLIAQSRAVSAHPSRVGAPADDASHPPGCLCDQCLCKKCDPLGGTTKKPSFRAGDPTGDSSHPPGCSCDKCLCVKCDHLGGSTEIGKPVDAVSSSRAGGSPHPPGCLCDPCVCEKCDPLGGQSEAGKPVGAVASSRAGAPTGDSPHPPGCLCDQCLCKKCDPLGGQTEAGKPADGVASFRAGAPTGGSSHPPGCLCDQCLCKKCDPLGGQTEAGKPIDTVPSRDPTKSPSKGAGPIHCICPTCTCEEGELKTTALDKSYLGPGAPSATGAGPSEVFQSAETLVLPKPGLERHMTQNSAPCDCPQCKCAPCADPTKQGAGVAGGQISAVPSAKPSQMKPTESLKKMDNLTLVKSIQAANKENCACREQIEEIKRTLEKIKCACTEAEFRSNQSIAQTMDQNVVAVNSGKPFVKQASIFGQTMSGLKMALNNLQAKCKAKDRMIEAMTGELAVRGTPDVFDRVLEQSQNLPIALDYDQADDVKSLDRSQMATNVIYPPTETKDNATEPCDLRTVASKGVEVRTHKHKKKKDREGREPREAKESAKKLDCSCSKPQIIQKEEKDCQKLDLSGFEVIDIRRITEDSLIVKWAAPKCDQVTGYDLFVNGTLASKVMSGSRTSAMMHSLDLTKSVQITIYAVSKCGRIEPPAIAIYEIKS